MTDHDIDIDTVATTGLPVEKRRRRVRLALLATVATLAVATGGFAVLRWRSDADAAAAPRSTGAAVRTAAVERTDLSTAQTRPGDLGYGSARLVKAVEGAVTWLPAAGDQVERGKVLYRRDDRPVSVFYGETPLFRRLDTANMVGRDVRVLVDNLRELGYPMGAQPPVGRVIPQPTAAASRAPAQPGPVPGGGEVAAPTSTPARVTVRDGDAVLTTRVITAVKSWQKAVGLPETGTLEPDDVVVLPGPARVSAVSAQLRDPAANGVLSVTGTDKVVTVAVRATEAGSVKAGAAVEVELPGGRRTPAKVSRVDTVAHAPANGGNNDSRATDTAEVNVTVTLNDPGAVGDLDAAPVQVAFTGETRTGVLAVPVAALLALREGGYAIQIVGGPLRAVHTGMFAMGMVEISGDGITEGTEVVTVS